jgi:hypothetical protein
MHNVTLWKCLQEDRTRRGTDPGSSLIRPTSKAQICNADKPIHDTLQPMDSINHQAHRKQAVHN